VEKYSINNPVFNFLKKKVEFSTKLLVYVNSPKTLTSNMFNYRPNYTLTHSNIN